MTLPEIITFASGPALPILMAGWGVKAALTYGAYRLWSRRRAARLASTAMGVIVPQALTTNRRV